jgi:hypothetical protein
MAPNLWAEQEKKVERSLAQAHKKGRGNARESTLAAHARTANYSRAVKRGSEKKTESCICQIANKGGLKVAELIATVNLQQK